MQRRLSAIVCADVAGYSRLMGVDESGTLAALKGHRAAIDPVVSSHGGRIVKTTGDGLLIDFSSVVSAVEAAIEIQATMAERGATETAERRQRLRIGVHLGDVIVDDGDIYGDGVNVAARLQEVAEPGEIAVSHVVAEIVRGKLAIDLIDLGPQRLKNIALPVGVFRLAAAGAAAARGARIEDLPALPDRPSIAVLPFANLSGDREQDYLADGIAEDILTGLSRHRMLFVIARNSSFAYRDRAIDVRRIGRELGVRYVLEGSVRRAGNSIRVTAQLIDAGSAAHVWADKYDSPSEAVFDLQDQITEAVVGLLEPTIREAEIERARRKRPENLRAYDHYLRGMARVNDFTRDGALAVLDHAAHAIALDPSFAPGYALAARAHLQRWSLGWVEDEAKERNEALDAIERGLRADRSDSVMLGIAGHGFAWFAHDLAKGIALLDQAIALNPNDSNSLRQSAIVRLRAGQTDRAIEHLTKALRISPRDPRNYAAFNALAMAHLLKGEHETAHDLALRATQQNPNYLPAWRNLACALALLGRVDEARQAIDRVLAITPNHSISRFRTAYPLSAVDQYEVVFRGLRLAGLPE